MFENTSNLTVGMTLGFAICLIAMRVYGAEM